MIMKNHHFVTKRLILQFITYAHPPTTFLRPFPNQFAGRKCERLANLRWVHNLRVRIRIRIRIRIRASPRLSFLSWFWRGVANRQEHHRKCVVL